MFSRRFLGVPFCALTVAQREDILARLSGLDLRTALPRSKATISWTDNYELYRARPYSYGHPDPSIILNIQSPFAMDPMTSFASDVLFRCFGRKMISARTESVQASMGYSSTSGPIPPASGIYTSSLNARTLRYSATATYRSRSL